MVFKPGGQLSEYGSPPSSLGRTENGEGVHWVPIDATAKILLEIYDHGCAPGSNNIFHILHPKPNPWDRLLLTAKRVLDEAVSARGRPTIEVISYHEWVSRLEAKSGIETISAEALAANTGP